MKKDKTRKKRLDICLVEEGLAADLPEAQALVMAGKVIVDDQRAEKPSILIPFGALVRIKGKKSKYISRGGEKLAFAIESFGLTHVLRGAIVLDVGASAGGFTDCCLQFGAKKIYALDVGTNQLAWRLRQDPRVISIEKTDIRDFDKDTYRDISFVVADISFNSLARLVPFIVAATCAKGVHYLVLVKPQFELPRAFVPRGGVVSDNDARQLALQSVAAAFAEEGLDNGRSVDCQIAGQRGNREIFFYVQRL